MTCYCTTTDNSAFTISHPQVQAKPGSYYFNQTVSWQSMAKIILSLHKFSLPFGLEQDFCSSKFKVKAEDQT